MKPNRTRLFIALPIVGMLFWHSTASAQNIPQQALDIPTTVQTPPLGGPVNVNLEVQTPGFDHLIYVDGNGISSTDMIGFYPKQSEQIWSPPPPLTIKDASFKSGYFTGFGGYRKLNVLLSDGSVWSIQIDEASIHPPAANAIYHK